MGKKKKKKKKKKKSPGRPELPASKGQRAVVTVRMSVKDRRMFKAEAAASKQKLSAWIRNALLDAVRRSKMEAEERKSRESNPTAADTAGHSGM